MCGGVVFPYKKEYREVLAQFYSPAELDEIERSGQVRSLYWQRGGEPVLPVRVEDAEEESQTEVMQWGNRDKNKPFPQTGWARVDSMTSGRWSYMKPKPALIPVTYGVEKGKWFEIDNGIRGVVVQRGDEKRVYMLTDQATPEFLEVTHHERMPVLQEQTDFDWLESEPPGTVSAI
jgi:hypothetical protein